MVSVRCKNEVSICIAVHLCRLYSENGQAPLAQNSPNHKCLIFWVLCIVFVTVPGQQKWTKLAHNIADHKKLGSVYIIYFL